MFKCVDNIEFLSTNARPSWYISFLPPIPKCFPRSVTNKISAASYLTYLPREDSLHIDRHCNCRQITSDLSFECLSAHGKSSQDEIVSLHFPSAKSSQRVSGLSKRKSVCLTPCQLNLRFHLRAIVRLRLMELSWNYFEWKSFLFEMKPLLVSMFCFIFLRFSK